MAADDICGHAREVGASGDPGSQGCVARGLPCDSGFRVFALREIDQLKKVYGMGLKATDSHRLKEKRR